MREQLYRRINQEIPYLVEIRTPFVKLLDDGTLRAIVNLVVRKRTHPVRAPAAGSLRHHRVPSSSSSYSLRGECRLSENPDRRRRPYRATDDRERHRNVAGAARSTGQTLDQRGSRGGQEIVESSAVNRARCVCACACACTAPRAVYCSSDSGWSTSTHVHEPDGINTQQSNAGIGERWIERGASELASLLARVSE